MSFDNGPRIVTNGLVLALDAADRNSYVSGSTTWFDLSGNNNNGTLANSPTFSSTNGGNLLFNGTNQYTSFSYQQPAQSSTSSFTWNIWLFYIGGGFNPILGNRFGGASWNKLTGVMFEYAMIQNLLVGSPTSNAWSNMSVVKNNTSFTLYRNATSISTGTNASSTSALPFYVGGDPGGEFSNCYVSNVQVYDRALSAAEITQNYNATKSRFNLT